MGPDQTNGNTKTDETYKQELSDDGGFVGVVPAGPLEKTEVDIVAVPAVGAHPERTWIPYLLQRPKERTKALDTASLPPRSSKAHDVSSPSRHGARSPSNEPPRSPRDIDDDGRDTSHGTWLTNDLREEIPQARILLYHHGNLREDDTLQSLAARLLRNICRQRESMRDSKHPRSRPIFFICHSTGGLVAKRALNIANEKEAFRPIANDNYGITFIATPHQGSAYLSSKEFWPSIREVMHLRSVIPESLQQQLRFGSVELRDMAEKFKRYSTDLRVTTYYETRDSDLAFTPTNHITPRSYHVPIASVASAIMDLEHESEIPLSSDHVGCATFEGDDEAQQTFISELKVAVCSAASLARVPDNSMDLENEVKVEVNGFFEDNTSSVKLWTARPSFADFLKHGPNILLKSRLNQPKEVLEPTLPKEDVQAATSNNSLPNIKLPPQDQNERRRKTVAPTDPGPQLPAMDRLKLTWVHIPYTHPGWVPRVLDAFPHEERPDTNLDFLKQEHWASNHNRGRHAAPHAKYVNSSFVNPTKGSRPPSDQTVTGFAVYLQYLHWDTYRQLLVRRLMIKRRMNQRRVRPIRLDVKDSKSLEAKMIWKYLGAEPPFHCRRTLDQYGYPNLRSTEARDDDQMLWKRTKPKSHPTVPSSKYYRSNMQEHYDYESRADVERSQSARHRSSVRQEGDTDESLQKKLEEVKATSQEGNVLMVDQLWLWALDEKTIVTFFPKKEGFSSEGRLSQQGDLHNDIYNEINSGLQSVPDAQTFAALIVQRAVTILLERTAHRHLQILRIYEESLSILIERMTRSYKSFRQEGFSVRPEAYYRKKNGEPMTNQEKHEKDMDVEKQSREDFSSLLELRDISDELHTIQKLFKEQRDILIDMARYYINGEEAGEMQYPIQNLTTFVREAVEAVEPQKRNENGLNYLTETERSLNSFERSVSEMIDSTKSTEQAYSSLLDIKQKQASVDESRLARSQMDATAAQSRAIMIFTIFTIIFLPLSFFTSVFGMNVEDWSGPNKPPPLHRVVYIIGPTSVGVICIALTLAFSISIRSLFVVARKIVIGVVDDLYHLLAKPLIKGSRLAAGILNVVGVQSLLDRISDRYLRNKDQDCGKDHGIWNEYALPMHKSARDMAYENDRVLSSRRRSFFNMIKGEKQ